MNQKKLLPHNVAPYKKVMEMLEHENVFLYEAAMGTGKSYIIASALKEKNLNALILVPNNTLNHTWEKVAKEHDIYIEIMTYSMFSRKDLPEVYGMAAKYDVIVCDECHHVGAEIWGGNLKAYRDYIEGMNKTYLIGLTATRIRYLDNMNDVARSFFKDNLIEGFTLGDAIAEGVLPTFTYISALFSLPEDIETLKSKIFRAKLSETDAEKVEKLFTRLQINEANAESMERIVKSYLGNEKHKVLVFVDKIDYIPKTKAQLARVFGKENIFTVHSERSPEKNRRAIKKFEECENATMFAINMFNEGLHLDGVDVIVMLRKTISANLFMQQLGRIMTPDNLGKPLFVFDFVGNHKNLKTDGRIVDIVNTLNHEVTMKSEGRYQIIVDDFAKTALDLLNDIGMFLPKYKLWTSEEDDILYKYYPSEREKVCERLPGRTAQSCKVRAGVLGLRVRRTMTAWTEEEHEILVKYFPLEGENVYLRLPNRTKEACLVRGRAIMRGVVFEPKEERKLWSAEENQILKEYYPVEGSKVAERLPDRSTRDCISKAQSIGLRSPRNWTVGEINILKTYYPEMGEECFKMIPRRTPHSCRLKAKELKLK